MLRQVFAGAVLTGAVVGVAALFFQRGRGLGSSTTRSLVGEIDAAYEAAERDIDAGVVLVRDGVLDGLEKFRAAEKRLDKLQAKIEKDYEIELDRVDDDDTAVDKDLDKLRGEIEDEGLGIGDVTEEDFYGMFQDGLAEARKLPTQIRRRRKQLLAIASR